MLAPAELNNRENPVRLIFSGRFGTERVFDLLNAYNNAVFSVPVILDLFGDGEINRVKECVQHNSKKNTIISLDET